MQSNHPDLEDVEIHDDMDEVDDLSEPSLWDNIKSHAMKEFEIIKYSWHLLILCGVWNYVHAFAHNLAYYFHVPRRTLYDLGFAGLPALDSTLQMMSEYLFFIIIAFTVIFALSPFYHNNRASFALSTNATNGIGPVRNDNLILMKDGYYLWNRKNVAPPPTYLMHFILRFLTTMAMAQTIRLTCFLITGLPGPNYHCRPFSPFYNPPITILELLFRGDVFFSCGDLVFSSHTTFIILSGLLYIKYGQTPILKIVSWAYISLFAILVLCARKHYTIDILMALYVVPLLWVANDSIFPDKYTQKIVDEDIPLPIITEKESKIAAYFHPRGLSNSNSPFIPAQTVELTQLQSNDKPVSATVLRAPRMDAFDIPVNETNEIIPSTEDILAEVEGHPDLELEDFDMERNLQEIDEELAKESY